MESPRETYFLAPSAEEGAEEVVSLANAAMGQAPMIMQIASTIARPERSILEIRSIVVYLLLNFRYTGLLPPIYLIIYITLRFAVGDTQ